MSKQNRIIQEDIWKRMRYDRFPVLCAFQNCFFDGLIFDYPYYSKFSGTQYQRYYHIPCAMVINAI